MAKMKMPGPEDLGGISQVFKASGLKQKLIFTFLMLVVYRLGIQVPVCGLDQQALAGLAQSGAAGNLIGFLDFFAGGGILKVSVFALSIGPYITASIIFQLLSSVVPRLQEIQKEEGEAGRRQIAQYTRYFTLILALFQSVVLISFLAKQGVFTTTYAVSPYFLQVAAIISMTVGAMVIMWLGELITEKGLGNGASLLIFFGIISGIPTYAGKTWELIANDAAAQLALVGLLAIYVATFVFVIIMHEAVRKIVIVNAKRQVGNKVYGGGNTHIPFKINPGGVMPIIFAVAILLFPATILQVVSTVDTQLPPVVASMLEMLNYLFSPAHWPYYAIYFALIVFLTFFYASIIPNLQPKEIANNLKKQGSAIPGVKPGKPTAEFLDRILARVTFIGAIGLGAVALIPNVATYITGINTLQGIGATAIIIIVGVALDTVNQVRTHMLVRQYEGFLRQ